MDRIRQIITRLYLLISGNLDKHKEYEFKFSLETNRDAVIIKHHANKTKIRYPI